jgi:hypothetical protein
MWNIAKFGMIVLTGTGYLNNLKDILDIWPDFSSSFKCLVK